MRRKIIPPNRNNKEGAGKPGSPSTLNPSQEGGSVQGKETFRFKQFIVRHDRSSMKVGTDGVLLGAWTGVKGAHTILDLGTGTGIIALMLAQRTSGNSIIEAVEVDEQACRDAEENFSSSPWKERLTLHQTSIQSFAPGKLFDLVVSNPPYFKNSMKPPDKQREHARHTATLSHADILHAAERLLEKKGRLAIILPFQEGNDFIELAGPGLNCIRKCAFRTRKNKPIERWLLEFSATRRKMEEEELVLYSGPGQWSSPYIALTKSFYLKL
jgi:tRNA1Val (adenine37-N6)-methyltransferase